MASKLDYLKKYLSKGGVEKGGGHEGSSAQPPSRAGRRSKHGSDRSTVRIRDMSEALPKPRVVADSAPKHRRGDLGFGGAMADDAEDETVFVDQQEVEERSRAAGVDTSGVGWTISKHGRRGNPQSRGVRAACAGDADLSPPRGRGAAAQARPARPQGEDSDLSPPRPAAAHAGARADQASGRPRSGDSGSDHPVPRKPPSGCGDQSSKSGPSAPRQTCSPRAAAGARQRAKGGAEVSDISPPPQSSRGRSSVSGARVGARASGADSDLSPPRPVAQKAACGKSAAGAASADSDLSPPRQPCQARAASGVRETVGGADSDLSPPRQGRPPPAATDAEPDGADSDLSPPRQQPITVRDGAGLAPLSACPGGHRKPGGRHDSDSDLSPPRQVAKSSSPERKRGRRDSDSDLSPPRGGDAKGDVATAKKGRERVDSDLSPPRASASKPANSAGKRARHDLHSDISPPRESAPVEPHVENMSSGLRAGLVSGSDLKEQARQVREARKAALEASDLSPPRATASFRANKAAKRARHDSESDISPPRGSAADEAEKMSSGLRAGLVNGSDLKEEARLVREARKAAILAAPDEETGRNATTVYRSKTGAKVTREEWVESQKKGRKKKLSEYPEQELQWGGGVKQQDNEEAQKLEVERIAAQPFARFQPDEKFVEELKQRQDWNDPMRKHQEEDAVREAAKSTANTATKPKCPHAPWPNRYNIPPGYRWDGKVRGTGFEKKWLDTKNGRECKQKQRWAHDMDEM